MAFVETIKKVTPLETIKNWIATYPGHNILNDFCVDYTDQIPFNGGIFPAGLTEVSRIQDVSGDIIVQNQYNFGLYYVFEKSPGDETGAEINADWLMEFQEWVQEQSILGKVPKFGDKTTAITAQNGSLYDAGAEGTATYMVQLSVSYEKTFIKER